MWEIFDRVIKLTNWIVNSVWREEYGVLAWISAVYTPVATKYKLIHVRQQPMGSDIALDARAQIC